MSARHGAPVSLALIHGFAFVAGDRTVRLPVSTQRLLVLLALARRPLERTQVAAGLWPDATASRAQANLRSVVWRAAETCAGALDVDVHRVALAPGVDVDLWAAQRLAERVLAPEPCLDALEPRARYLLSGDLLPDWPDEEWVGAEREEFHQLRLHGLEAMSRRLAAAGRFAEAVSAAFLAVRAEPYRESAHAALIAAHLAEGNRHEARRQFHRFRHLLLAEMGVEPVPELQAMVLGTPGPGAVRGHGGPTDARPPVTSRVRLAPSSAAAS